MASRVPPPSPKEIALRAREIRRGWSPGEAARRCVYKTKVLYVPVSAKLLSDRAACCTEFRPTRRLMQLD